MALGSAFGGLGGNRTTFARAPREERCKEYSNLAGERRARVMRSFFRAGTLSGA